MPPAVLLKRGMGSAVPEHANRWIPRAPENTYGEDNSQQFHYAEETPASNDTDGCVIESLARLTSRDPLMLYEVRSGRRGMVHDLPS